jgi:hypothetical protein
MALLGGRSSLLGIDIGSSSIKLVRLQQTKGSWELVAFNLGHLPPDAIVEGRIMNFAVVIERLRDDCLGRIDIQAVVWEYEPLGAHDDFQGQIPPPRETDIVVSILWSRIGTLLAERHRVEGLDRALTGTEFEIEDALAAYRKLGRPTLLIYKKDAEIDYRGLSHDQHLAKLDQVRLSAQAYVE